jgi:hypothetical protein
VIDHERAAWLAFLAMASAWVAGVAGLAALPVSASAVVLARSGGAAEDAAWLLARLSGLAAAAALAWAGISAWTARRLLLQAPGSADDTDEGPDDHHQ